MTRLEVVGDETADELVALLLFGAEADAEAAREELDRRVAEAAEAAEEARWRRAS